MSANARATVHAGDQRRPDPVRAQEFLRWSAVALAVGFGTHAVDHVRRGMSAATMLVMIGGGAEAVSIAIAVVMVLTRRAWAGQAAIVVGFGGFRGSASPRRWRREFSSDSREFKRCDVEIEFPLAKSACWQPSRPRP
jgi:hypothetical protein